jgi:O-antigen ligase
VIWAHEWNLFVENPVFGVGPGGGEMNRALTWGRAKASHTEITRLPAEHGIFGVAALMLLFVLTVSRTLSLRNAPVMQRALSVSFMAWAVAFSLHAAMRLAAPGFLFGLAFATFLVDDADLIGRRRSKRRHAGAGTSGGRARQ